LKIALVLVFGFSIVQAQENGAIGDAARIALEPTCNPCTVNIGAKKVILKGATGDATDLDGTSLDYPIRFQPQKGPWYNRREQSTTKAFVTWTFKVAANEDAFICFGNFHVPRLTATTADSVACVAAQDKVELKDTAGAGTLLLTCCGTQCHGNIYKLASQTAERTYTVTLTLGSKATYTGDARWNDPSGTLPDYKGIDIVHFQVSSSKTTIAEDKRLKDATSYITLTNTDFTESTDFEWRNYIDTLGTSDNADAATCETACTAADKKCNFYIWATVDSNERCYFGNFARAASTALAGLETGTLIRTGITTDGVVKLKKGALGDGIPAFKDHKAEENLIAQFVVAAAKDTSVDSEGECAARCALGYKNGKNAKCSGYKYNADTKDCFYIDWEAENLDDSTTVDKIRSPTGLVVPTKLEKNKVFNPSAAAAAQRTACNAPNGAAVIEATQASVSFTAGTNTNVCKLIVKNTNPGKKVTLSLPASFGGTATGTTGGILVYAGLGTGTSIADSSNEKGVILYKNDLTTALAAITTIEWYAPVVTIHFENAGTPAFAKADGVSITFET